MKFHECISHIYVRGNKDSFLGDVWWRYFWRSLELLHDEDYTHHKWEIDEFL